MSKFSKSLVTLSALTMMSSIAVAMPGHDDMSMNKMSARQMKQLKACKAMDHAMAMKNARCKKLMMAEEMKMKEKSGDGAMSDHKM